MPTINPVNQLNHYLFTKEELRTAKIFNELQLMYFQNLLHNYIMQKIGMLVPEDPANDRSYFLQKAEIEGKIGAIQELIDNHYEAFREQKDILKEENPAITGETETAVAVRASQQVHNS